ncbi:MAG: bifunctional hydroxymethylpyrimidine kinase/phosphomethylpyrimidine kinase [Clostridia bacterium]|nr:bifunctional hydroxymethylpyrimidine kinase/phosphomethylpyrimidine kinase [Clostridia bacterium]
MKKVLTIAGSDCSGGAGIQADLKTIMAHKCYGMSVITALTAQNTTGVYAIDTCAPELVKKQLTCVMEDIEPDAIKIGMVSSVEIIRVIAETLLQYKAKNIVLDPVMVSTSGSSLMSPDAIDALCNILMPLATVITPNLFEAELLSEHTIKNTEDMLIAAGKISKKYRGNILIKGGHLDAAAYDLLYTSDHFKWFKAKRLDNTNTHGTGCTLSSAIASNLALGHSIEESINNGKNYVTGAIADNMDLGKGRGPLNHCYCLL